MTELDRLEADVLQKLSMLAEGRAGDYDRLNLHRAHPGSTAPPGTVQGAESPLTSLMEYHKGLLEKARERGTSTRLMAIAAAHADYDYTIRRQPTFNSVISDENTDDRDTAILVHFEGTRPEWPAAYLGCSASHVEKLRRRHRRDAVTGVPVGQSEAFAA